MKNVSKTITNEDISNNLTILVDEVMEIVEDIATHIPPPSPSSLLITSSTSSTPSLSSSPKAKKFKTLNKLYEVAENLNNLTLFTYLLVMSL